MTSGASGLSLQIGTTVSRYNVDDLEAIAGVVGEYGAVMWSLFFLVPTGRGRREDMVSAEEHERVFNWLYDLSKTAPFDVRTTAAQHYRRVVIQRRRQEAAPSDERSAGDGRRLQLRRRARAVEPRRERRQRLRLHQPHRRRVPQRLPAASRRERARAGHSSNLSRLAAVPRPARLRQAQRQVRRLRFPRRSAAARGRAPTPSPATIWNPTPTASTSRPLPRTADGRLSWTRRTSVSSTTSRAACR